MMIESGCILSQQYPPITQEKNNSFQKRIPVIKDGVKTNDRYEGAWKSFGFLMKGLRNPPDFEEAGFGKPILLKEQSNFIWRVSFLSLFSSIYAFHRGYYDLSLAPGGVFLTSILYWYKPDYSWRRTLDMTYVKLAISYQLIRSYKAQYSNMYYLFLFGGICCYQLGVYYYKNNKLWHSTYAHSMLHVLANISNVILYSGSVGGKVAGNPGSKKSFGF